MKILTEEEIRAQSHATMVGGMKGFFGGLAFALPASYVAHKRWSYYRSLPPSIKALGVITIVVPSFVIAAEQAGHTFEQQQWTGIGKEELDAAKTTEQLHWESLSPTGKVGEWASKNKWGVILGSWATTMIGSFAVIMRDRYQTFPQKIVQARMWAQGLTVGMIIGSAVMTAQSRQKTDRMHPMGGRDHSWAHAARVNEVSLNKKA